MKSRYQALVQERADLVAEAKALYLQVESEGRDLTDEDRRRDDERNARLEVIAADLTREERRREWERTVQPLTPQPWDSGPRVTQVHDRAEDEPWESFGHFLQAVAAAGTPGGRVDPRLYRAAAPSGASSGVPSEGGFLVQTDYSNFLLDRGYNAAVLAPLCQSVEIGEGSDGLEAPMVDETSRANGSRWGGVRVYRRGEADTVTATKPKFGLWDLRLEDLMGLAYSTDRLLRDARALASVLTQAFAEEFAFKVDDEIVRGTGAGESLGLLNSGALITVAKETGQAAATIVAENAMKMRARLWARSRPRSVWFINQDVEPQLQSMTVVVGTGGVPVYLPAGGLSADSYDRLYGRPVIPIEQCESLGTVGDILLADLSQYVLIRKGGIEAAESMHVRFLYNERTFRWVYRINGMPKWITALTPYKGTSNTQSPFVALATRA